MTTPCTCNKHGRNGNRSHLTAAASVLMMATAMIHAQTTLTENFESTTAPGVPTGWATVGVPANGTFATTAGTGNPGQSGNVTQTASVTSPVPRVYLVHDGVSFDATQPLSVSFSFFVGDGSTSPNYGSTSFIVGDVRNGLASPTAGKFLNFQLQRATFGQRARVWDGVNNLLVNTDGNNQYSISANSWVSGTFTWTPTFNTTGTFTFTWGTSSGFKTPVNFTFDSPEAYVGFGTMREPGRFDNISITGQLWDEDNWDSDGDGLPNFWEALYFNSPTAAVAGDDDDMDGLTNLQEYQLGLHPKNPDSDNDGLIDGASITVASDDPRYNEWEALGIVFTEAGGQRIFSGETTIGTDPLNPDSDGDGLPDGIENNSGIWVSASNPGTSPTNPDTDGDGLKDGVETNTGSYVSPTDTGTNPHLADTDGDGAGDWYEITASFTDPHNPTSKPNIPYPLPDYDGSPGVSTKPVKVYLMSGQSNMLGFGQVTGNGPGTLETIVNQENKFPHVASGGGWVTRNDVHVHSIVENNTLSKKLLNPIWKGDKYGPELGFGTVMGWYHDEPVLIIKPSIGNRSLGWDFLPPGSDQYDFTTKTYPAYGESPESWNLGGSPTPFGWYAGKQFDDYFLDEAHMSPALTWSPGISYPNGCQLRHHGILYRSKSAHTSEADSEPGTGAQWGTFWSVYSVTNTVDILDNFATQYPAWAAQGFEIAGFVWWQGHKDGGEQGTGALGAHASRYEQNLVQLITELRTYYENRYPGKIIPNAPFVVATCGFGGGNWNPGSNADTIWKAQMAVSDPAKHPAFADNVASVDTRAYWRNFGPSTQSYHYNWNAETYLLTGDAAGREMIRLLESVTTPNGGYSTWANGSFSGTLTDRNPSLDFDNGGLATAIEWVTGGDPTDDSDDAELAPTLETTGDPDGKTRFIFRRTAAAKSDSKTSIIVQYGSTLEGWTDAVHQGAAANQITVAEDIDGFGPGIDKVTVALPLGLADEGKLFVRLKVSIAP